MLRKAEGLLHSGRPGDADRLCRQILSQAPQDARALHLLGLISLHQDQASRAVRLIERAITIDPEFALAFANLGTALRRLGRHDAALEAFLRAASLDPQHPGYQNNLGVELRHFGRLDEAAAYLDKAVAIDPGYAEAHSNRGETLRIIGRFDEGEVSHRRALALQPDNLNYRLNFGRFLLSADRRADALILFENILSTLAGRNDPEAALLRADATWNLAFIHLAEERYAEGFAAYEARFAKRRRVVPARSYHRPSWRGENLAGRTILVHSEQGIGDVIQCARYVPLLAERAARVVVECQAPLRRLLGTLGGIEAVITRGDPLPAIDYVAPIVSLPHRFATRIDTIPATIPYLRADSALVASWQARLGRRRGFRVAFIWRGNRQFRDNRHRSTVLDALVPLLDLPGLEAYSLQFDAEEDERAFLANRGVIDLVSDLGDFADTAAAISQMDLLIATDTGTVHLAGALGFRAWVLLHTAADWRWSRDRTDSPWYPSLRLFRQRQFGDWTSVVDEVKEALRERLARGGGAA
jgi:Flp pilus assembly protein TadD